MAMLVLASIYNGLREISSSNSLSKCDASCEFLTFFFFFFFCGQFYSISQQFFWAILGCKYNGLWAIPLHGNAGSS